MKGNMNKYWKFIFIILLIWSIYHLIRDIFTDISGIHNPLFDFGHREYLGTYWCSFYCQYTTFPLEIFNIIAITVILKRNDVGILGTLVLFTLPIWLSGWFMGSGPLFQLKFAHMTEFY